MKLSPEVIEAATEAITEWHDGWAGEPVDFRHIATLTLEAAFESIDTSELADVILAESLFGGGTAMDTAQAVKNWLTGKEQKQ